MGVLGWDRLTPPEQDELAHQIVTNRPAPSPWAIELQPTNKCNVDCFFCSSSPFREDEFLEWELVESILRWGGERNLRNLRLSGGGESMIYPQVNKLLDLAVELGIAVTDVTTNGTTLTRYAQPLAENGLQQISISLNEPTPALYAKTMRCNERIFDKALDGVRAMVEARDARPALNNETEERPKIELKIMFYKENWGQGLEMLRLGQELDVDEIMINNIMFLPDEERIPAADLPRVRDMLSEMIRRDFEADRSRLHFWLDAEARELQQHAMSEVGRYDPQRFAPDVADTAERSRYCLMGWYNAVVSAKGIVYPCCNFVGMPDKTLGRLSESNMEEIWHGEPYRRFRAEFRQLMLLRGEMQHSRKTQQFLEPMCIAETECPFSWGLCSGKFYGRVAEELHTKASNFEKLEARTKDRAIRTAQKAKKMLARAQ